MEQVSLSKAADLVEEGVAGWFAVNAEPPIHHNEKYVVSLLDGRHFVVSGEDVQVKSTQANFDPDSDIGQLLVLDVEKSKKETPRKISFATLIRSFER